MIPRVKVHFILPTERERGKMTPRAGAVAIWTRRKVLKMVKEPKRSLWEGDEEENQYVR